MQTAEIALPAGPSKLPLLAVALSALGLPTFMLGLGLSVTLPLMLGGLALGFAGLFLAHEDTPSSQIKLSLLALVLGGLTPIVSVLSLLAA